MYLNHKENDFILRVRAGPGEGNIDEIIIRFMNEPDITLTIKGRYVCILSTEAYYHIRISRLMLFRLKERIDKAIEWETFDLFELRDW